MTDKDDEILTYARKIRKYCSNNDCDECVFSRKDNGKDVCRLGSQEEPPCYWVIPNKIKVE